MKILKNALVILICLGALGALTDLYLYPGMEAVYAGRTDTVMSDGTDPTGITYLYDAALQVWKEHPSRFLYGAVYSEVAGDPEHGSAIWMPWNERWLVLGLSKFVPLEQISTSLVFLLFIFDAVAMYFLSRQLRWSKSISVGLAFAWAFNCFNRARAKVHGAMVGAYHLPLIFLAILLLVRGKKKRSIVAAAILLLLASTVAHYFLLTTLFLSPFFIYWLLLQPEYKLDRRRVLARFVLAVFPTLIFLGSIKIFPIPANSKMTSSAAVPKTGKTENGEIHPNMTLYPARPIDYLGGDISLEPTSPDLNWLREQINISILDHLDGSNPHERTNGIRWSILILSLLALLTVFSGWFSKEPEVKRNIVFFAGFALFSFWLSLSPMFPWPKWGASYWLYSLFSQIRVPSRAGINVHFALLMMTGFFLSSKNIKWTRWLSIPGVFAALMILDYPPLVQTMPMARIQPQYTQLSRQNGVCGAGMYFPFVNDFSTGIEYLTLLQRMRGSDCLILNGMTSLNNMRLMISLFPPTPDFVKSTPVNPSVANSLIKIARCVPMTWIVFDPSIDNGWVKKICSELGWGLREDLTCVASDRSSPLRRLPVNCN